MSWDGSLFNIASGHQTGFPRGGGVFRSNHSAPTAPSEEPLHVNGSSLLSPGSLPTHRTPPPRPLPVPCKLGAWTADHLQMHKLVSEALTFPE